MDPVDPPIYIYRLPIELLRGIIWLDINSSPKPRGRGRERWRILLLVCTKWRSALYDMHELWADDALQFGLIEDRLNRVIARAGDLPLRFTFKILDERHVQNTLTHITRSKTLQFDHNCPPGVYQAVLRHLSTTATPLTSLQRLEMPIDLYDSSSLEYQSSTFLDLAPELRCVVLRNIHLGLAHTSKLAILKLFLTNTSLQPSMDTLLDVLASNPELQILELGDSFHSETAATSTREVTLLHLRHCEIWFQSKSARLSVPFLASLTMPGLKTLNIYHEPVDSNAETHVRALALLHTMIAKPHARGTFCPQRLEFAHIFGFFSIYGVDFDATEDATGGEDTGVDNAHPQSSSVHFQFWSHTSDDVLPVGDGNSLPGRLVTYPIYSRVKTVKLDLDGVDAEDSVNRWLDVVHLCSRTTRLYIDSSVAFAMFLLGHLTIPHHDGTSCMPDLSKVVAAEGMFSVEEQANRLIELAESAHIQFESA